MLTKARQSKYFTKITRSAASHLDSFCRTRDAEALHRFRVDIKKLAAIINFVKSHPGDGSLRKLFQPMYLIFKKAGDIRALDVNRELIAGFPFVKPPFISSLQLIRDKKAGAFIAAAEKNKAKMEWCRQNICDRFFDVDQKFIQKKFKKQLTRISVLLKKGANHVEMLHNARKKIKMLLNTYEYFPKSITGRLRLSIGYLNAVQHSIGGWHDLVQAKEVLANAGYLNPGIFKKLEMEDKWQQRQLRKLTRGFMKKVKSS